MPSVEDILRDVANEARRWDCELFSRSHRPKRLGAPVKKKRGCFLRDFRLNDLLLSSAYQRALLSRGIAEPCRT